ncbi:MAG TPA: site-2 protease family protein [archaeon]|nr:site-2 protease family protein [archaeon]
MVSLELASMLLFFVIVSILIYRDRKNIEFSYGIVIKRWKKGKELIDKIVNKRRKFIAYAGTVGVIAGVIASFIGMYFLLSCAFFPQLLPDGTVEKGCFKLVLPSVSGAEKYYPQQVFGIPFWYWLISIFVIIFFHESMHAVYARLEKVPVKSYGIMFLLALPIGAFVDPDNNKLKRLSSFKKLRIYAAGSFGNFILAAFVILLIFGTNYLTTLAFDPAGVSIGQLGENSPALAVTMSGIIYKINDVQVNDLQALANFMDGVNPGDQLKIYTTDNTYDITTAKNPANESRAYIGISMLSTAYKYKFLSDSYASKTTISIIVQLQSFLVILFILSLGVGIANMLPLKPFDGGLFYEEILMKKFGREKGKKIIRASSWIVFLLIVFNLVIGPIKLF